MEMVETNKGDIVGTPPTTESPTNTNIVNTEKVGLNRSIGLVGASGLIVGCIIGSGIFITPTSVLEKTGSIGFSLIMWIISGLIATIGGLCFAELGTTIPESGAEYNYILAGVGPIPAFLFIWSSVFIIKPSSITIIAITSAIYLGEAFFPGCIVPEIIYKCLAAVVILIVTLLNVVSVKWSIRINSIIMYSKFVAVFIFVVTGLVNLREKEARDYFKNPFTDTRLDAGSIGGAFFQTLWAYDGFNNLNYASEEMINPEKNLPRSIVIGMILVSVSYLAINICYIAAIGPNGILESQAVGLTIGYAFFGKFSFIVPVLVALSTFGSALSTIFGNGRLLYVAAREGHLPVIMSSIHRKLHTPIASLVFTALISLIMLIPDVAQLDELINLFLFANWFFFLLCFGSQIYLRFKKPDLARPFKVWIVLPIFMCITSVVLIILPIFEVKTGIFIALGTILSAIPFYLVFIMFKHKLPQVIFKYFDIASNYLMNVYDLEVAKKEEDLG